MKKHLLPIAVILFITLIFFYPIFKGLIPFPGDLLAGGYEPYKSRVNLGYAPGGVPNKAQGPDVIRESFPWKYFAITSIQSGQIPFWTPYSFSGNPIMANFQSAVFYPLNIVFLALPFLSAWTLFIFLSPLLAGIFNYYFLKELKLSNLASIFGGVVFAFSSYMVVWLQYGNITHTLLWLPLALLFTERITKKLSPKNFIFLNLVLFTSILGGYIQGYFYLVIVITFYFIFKILKKQENKSKTIFLFFTSLVFPVLLSLFQLLPTLELFKYSTRGNYSIDQIQNDLNPLWYIITVIIPDFFGHPATRTNWFYNTYIESVSYFGLIPFILAVSSLLFFKSKKAIEIKIFGILFVCSFFLAVDLIINRYLYLIPIPVLSTTLPTRILSIFQFSGAVLAAFGLQYLLQKENKKIFLKASISVLFILLACLLFSVISPKFYDNSEWALNMGIAKRAMILPLFYTLCFIVFIGFYYFGEKIFKGVLKKIYYILPIFLVLVTIFDLFYFFHKITPFSPKEFTYPQTQVIDYIKNNAGFYRYWGYGAGYVSSNFQNVDRTFSPEGDDPLHIKSYTELLEASGNNGIVPSSLPRVNSNIPHGYGQEDLRKNIYRQKILNILGIKYILHKNDFLGSDTQTDNATYDPEIYKLVWQEAPWQIYENKQVLPRAFLAFNYEILDKENTLKRIFDKNFNPRDAVILEEKLPINLGKDENAKVTIEKYEQNKIALSTNSKANALLFLSDNFYPGWTVTIDGKNAKVYKADYTFRAVPVEKGEHEVVFLYNPKSFSFGLILSSLSFLGLILTLIIFSKRKIFK